MNVAAGRKLRVVIGAEANGNAELQQLRLAESVLELYPTSSLHDTLFGLLLFLSFFPVQIFLTS